MFASDSGDSSHSSDTEDSSSPNTSGSSMPGTYRFEPSKSDSEASGKIVCLRRVDPYRRIQVLEFQECSTHARQEATVMCQYTESAT